MKELRKTKKRTAHNFRIKTNIKALMSKSKQLIEKGDLAEAKKMVLALQVALDKAAKVNVISKNSASRKKSRIMKMIAKPATK